MGPSTFVSTFEGIVEKPLQPGERVTMFENDETSGIVIAVFDKGDVYVLWSIKIIEKFQQKLKAFFIN